MSKKIIIQSILCLFAIQCIAIEDDMSSPYTPSDTEFLRGLTSKGLEIKAYLDVDSTWDLAGGKHRGGAYEYLFEVSLRIDSARFLHYPGGVFYTSFDSHHGQNPTIKNVGAFSNVDNNEAPSFDELYAFWYRQSYGNFWILAGKSDAFYNFTFTKHTLFFLNAAYDTIPTILFFPTYPNPAMSVIGSISVGYPFSVTLGVFDGSTALGQSTGTLGVFGHFFNDLADHAFLIGEVDFEWNAKALYKGRLGLGAWKHTAKFKRFNGGTQKGTSGSYLTLDQIIYKSDQKEVGAFFEYGYANPQVSAANHYICGGIAWEGMGVSRLDDLLGIGFSSVIFSQEKGAGFKDTQETSYEIFYKLQINSCSFLQPDFQYVVHPGGKGLPNASVLTLRLQLCI